MACISYPVPTPTIPPPKSWECVQPRRVHHEKLVYNLVEARPEPRWDRGASLCGRNKIGHKLTLGSGGVDVGQARAGRGEKRFIDGGVLRGIQRRLERGLGAVE